LSRLYVVSTGATEQDLVMLLEASVERAFRLPAARLPLDFRISDCYDFRRKQYSSILIMRKLLQILPRDATRLLAVVEEDLFIPMLSFIYGQAQVNGPVALMSLARLRPEFYGLPADPDLLGRRASKEALHELGHTFGLVHCLEQACPMALSTNIVRLDAKGADFCSGCYGSIRENIDIITGRSA
jgi:archaemetzincin